MLPEEEVGIRGPYLRFKLPYSSATQSENMVIGGWDANIEDTVVKLLDRRDVKAG